MKDLNKVFLLLVSSLILSSCLDAEKKAHFRSIDKMVETLDSLEAEFKALPNDSFVIIKKEAYQIENQVKTYFVEDTIDIQFARRMNHIRDIRKGSDFILMRKMFLDTIFDFQRNQLQVLREDIQNGSGKRDAYDSYVDSEIANVEIISSSFNDYKLRFKVMRDDYYQNANAIRLRLEPFITKAAQ